MNDMSKHSTCADIHGVRHRSRDRIGDAANSLLDLTSSEQHSQPLLEVELATRNGIAVCRPKGNLDATTVSTFRGAVGLCLGEPGLIVDLSGVHFIDGAGLTALVGVVRRAQEQPARVAVIVPAGSLRKVLDDAGLDLIVNVSETVELALADMQGEGSRMDSQSPRFTHRDEPFRGATNALKDRGLRHHRRH
jgi:stage II sporulation protein AA (anti-sigma F factor antagonist)